MTDNPHIYLMVRVGENKAFLCYKSPFGQDLKVCDVSTFMAYRALVKPASSVCGKLTTHQYSSSSN